MNEKFNKNAKLETFTNILGIAVRLIVIDPLPYLNTKYIDIQDLAPPPP